GRRDGGPHLEVVRRGAGDGVDQSLQRLLVHVDLLQRERDRQTEEREREREREKRERQTDRQTDRQRQTERDRERGGRVCRYTSPPTNTHSHKHTHTHTPHTHPHTHTLHTHTHTHTHTHALVFYALTQGLLYWIKKCTSFHSHQHIETAMSYMEKPNKTNKRSPF